MVVSQVAAFRHVRSPLLTGTALGTSLMLAALLTASPARADCLLVGSTVTCAPPGTGGFVAAADDLNVTVVPGATVVDDGVQALSINSTSSITNNGTVNTVTANSLGILVNGDANTITNNGALTAGGTFTAGIAINGINNTFFNSATGLITVSGDFSRGIASNGDNRITNDGTIIVSGLSDPGNALSIGILPFTGDIVTNSGSILITSADSVGILATNGQPTTINGGTGTIVASGARSIGISAVGSGVTTNAGSILATGTDSVGIALQGNSPFNPITGTFDPSFVNNGTIIASGAGARAISTRFSSVLIINNGLIDGRIVTNPPTGGDALFNSGTIQISNGPLATHALNAGLYRQETGGTFVTRVDSTGASDRLTAFQIQILGGTLRVVVQPGLYGQATLYNVMNTCGFGCLTGTFNNVTTTSPFFTATPSYDADNANVTLNRIAFNAVAGLTSNQLAVANAITPFYSQGLTGNAATLYGNLLAFGSPANFDQLSGQGHAASQNAIFGAGALFTGGMLNPGPSSNGATTFVFQPTAYAATPAPRGHEAFAALKAQPAIEQPGRWRLWTLGFGNRQSFDGEIGLGANQTVSTAGGSFGADRRFGDGFALGFAVGASSSRFSVGSLFTNGDITGGHLGAYAQKTWGAFYAAGSLSYGRFSTNTTRTVAVGLGLIDTATANYDSDLLSGRLELGWRQAYGRFVVTPFAAVQPALLRQDGFAETSAGILGLIVPSRTTHSLPTFLGAQFETSFAIWNGAVLTPVLRASWVHEFEPNREISAALVTVPAAGFTVGGARPARDAARIEAGTKLALRGNVGFFTNLNAELSSRSTSYGVSGGIRALW